MPRYTIKIKDLYFHWSTVTDAPVSKGMDLEEYRQWYKDEYGRQGYRERRFDMMIERLENHAAVSGFGTVLADTLEEATRFNRAGVNESFLLPDEIYEMYKDIKVEDYRTEDETMVSIPASRFKAIADRFDLLRWRPVGEEPEGEDLYILVETEDGYYTTFYRDGSKFEFSDGAIRWLPIPSPI